MPMMHRLSCFRDDIVFFVYLYQVGQTHFITTVTLIAATQRWIYRTDYSRANEFGLIPDQPKKEDDEEEEEKRSIPEEKSADTSEDDGAAGVGLRKRATARRPSAGAE